MNKSHLVQFRAEHNLSLEELGKLLSMSKSSIFNYETGVEFIPYAVRTAFMKLADAVGFDYTKNCFAVKYNKHWSKPVSAEIEAYVNKVLPTPPVSPPVQQTAPHAEHYASEIDPITFAEANFSEEELLGFFRISAIKYLARYGKKNGKNPDDLDKAMFYINKMKEV